MRAVIIGGSGQIGGWLLRLLTLAGHEAVGTYATVPYPGLDHVDAADLPGAAAWLKSQKPDVVFYPAGFTWVDGCEKDPARARSANCDQPLNLARTAAELGARFVYFSTDYVFDGVSGPYSETDPTNALSVYGQAKLEAEEALARELGDSQLNVRTCWVFGPERQGKNFAYQLVRTLRAGRELTCPSDQISSPSYGPDVARAVIALVEAKQSGVIHVAGPEVMSRPDFARAIASAFDLNVNLIISKPTAELVQGAPRPLNSGLKTPRLDAFAPGLMRTLVLSLADFRERLSASEGWADPFAQA
jgi:dTDP-4-dehydrorhamnose reductase